MVIRLMLKVFDVIFGVNEGVLCMSNYDVTKDGVMDLLVGRDDGQVEVYGFNDGGEPVLKFNQVCSCPSVIPISLSFIYFTNIFGVTWPKNVHLLCGPATQSTLPDRVRKHHITEKRFQAFVVNFAGHIRGFMVMVHYTN